LRNVCSFSALCELVEEQSNGIKPFDEIIGLEYNRKQQLLFAKTWCFDDVLVGYIRRLE